MSSSSKPMQSFPYHFEAFEIADNHKQIKGHTLPPPKNNLSNPRSLKSLAIKCHNESTEETKKLKIDDRILYVKEFNSTEIYLVSGE